MLSAGGSSESLHLSVYVSALRLLRLYECSLQSNALALMAPAELEATTDDKMNPLLPSRQDSSQLTSSLLNTSVVVPVQH